ncbi:MAG: purine-nucleoside phosphorylase [Candidatus Cloacimonadales bacterium]|nr:purine-nucleoside phosphorylase [Candidatus Cloacimonadales bacterium]
MLEKINKAADFIRTKVDSVPEIGLILGTGLNSLAEMVRNAKSISYKDIPGMAVSTAPSHQGKFIFGKLANKSVVIMQGRLHYYEGYSMQEVTFPIRIMQALGVKTLLVTNAAGSLNEELQPGDIVLITDHINFTGNNPLIGKNYAELGERFPSMNEPYSKRLIGFCQEIAAENDFEVKKGIYTGLSGPSLETRAECNMLVFLGSDLVGMSTVPEVIVAIQSEMEVLGISVVTNLSNIFHNEAHSQEQIWENAEKARINLEKLILCLLKKI